MTARTELNKPLMAVGKRKANIHINIILTLLYRVWCGSIAMGEGTSNKCHYKRAWDWRAPAILTIQSAECSQENVNKRERLCWLGLTLLFDRLCSRCWWSDYLLWLLPSGRTPGCQIPTRSLHQTEKQKPFWSTPRLYGFVPLHWPQK